MIASHTTHRIAHGTLNQLFDVFLFQIVQLKNNGSGNQSWIYLKIWVFCRCANQNDCSILYKWQQIILLSFIKTMNLINKKNSPASVHSLKVFCTLYYVLHIFFSGYSCIKLCKLRACRIGDHHRKRCLSCSWRTIKNNGAKLICLNCAVQHRILPDDMLLTNNFIKCFWTHTRRKR